MKMNQVLFFFFFESLNFFFKKGKPIDNNFLSPDSENLNSFSEKLGETGSFLKLKNEEQKENPFKSHQIIENNEKSENSNFAEHNADREYSYIHNNNENQDPNENQIFPDHKKIIPFAKKPSKEIIFEEEKQISKLIEENNNIEKILEAEGFKKKSFKSPKKLIYPGSFMNFNSKPNEDLNRLPKSYKGLLDSDFDFKDYKPVELKKPPPKENQIKKSQTGLPPKNTKNENIKSFLDLKKYQSFLQEVTNKNSSMQNLEAQYSSQKNEKEDYKQKFANLKNELHVLSKKINNNNNPNPLNFESHQIEENVSKSENREEDDIFIPSLKNFDQNSEDKEKLQEETQKSKSDIHSKINEDAKGSVHSMNFDNRRREEQEPHRNLKYSGKTVNKLSEYGHKIEKENKYMKTFSLQASAFLRNLHHEKEEDRKNSKFREQINDFERNKQEKEKLFIVHGLIESFLNLIDYDKNIEQEPKNSNQDFFYQNENNNNNLIEKKQNNLITSSRNMTSEEKPISQKEETKNELEQISEANVNQISSEVEIQQESEVKIVENREEPEVEEQKKENSLSEVEIHQKSPKNIENPEVNSNNNRNYKMSRSPEMLSRINSSKQITKTSLEFELKKNYSLSLDKDFDNIDIKDMKEEWLREKTLPKKIITETEERKEISPEKMQKEAANPNFLTKQLQDFKSLNFQKEDETESNLIHSLNYFTQNENKDQKQDLKKILPTNYSESENKEQQIPTSKTDNDLKNIKDLYEENKQNLKNLENNGNNHEKKGEVKSLRNCDSFDNKSNDVYRSMSLRTIENDQSKISKRSIEPKLSYFQKTKEQNLNPENNNGKILENSQILLQSNNLVEEMGENQKLLSRQNIKTPEENYEIERKINNENKNESQEMNVNNVFKQGFLKDFQVIF